MQQQLEFLAAICTQNTAVIDRAMKENESIVSAIKDLHSGGAVPSFDYKEKELLRNLQRMLDTVYKRHTAVVPVTDCQIHLRRIITIEGDIWDWELVLPEAPGLATHHKVFYLNSCSFMPSCCKENESFVRFLIERGVVKQFLCL